MGKKSGKKDSKPDLENLTPEESLKLEIAQELGLLDRVMEGGWRSLSAKETGRIGGLVGKRKKSLKKEALTGAESGTEENRAEENEGIIS